MSHVRLCVSVGLAVMLGCFAGGVRPEAQSLNAGLFDRYLEALRQQYKIPGVSVVVAQNGSVVMSRGLGHAEVSQSVPARPDTPYPVLNLSETVGSALVLRHCLDRGTATLTDRILRWLPPAAQTFNATATFDSALGHISASGTYAYDPDRFGALSDVVQDCTERSYRSNAALLFDELAMRRSVPGRDVVDSAPTSELSAATLERHRQTLADLAVPYRVASSGAVSRSDYSQRTLTAATGIVSTALDLAEFVAALDRGLVVSPALRNAAFERRDGRPTGLGWFVQTYAPSNDKLVWHFGLAKDAYSSIILNVPTRGLTLIMLANSDALAASLNPMQPDVTQSIFARTFLKLFIG